MVQGTRFEEMMRQAIIEPHTGLVPSRSAIGGLIRGLDQFGEMDEIAGN
jgi:hypothetical protein